MEIGSYRKMSTIDYPGRISFVVGVQGCNMACPWCHNMHLVPRITTNQIFSVDRILGWIEVNRNLIDGVVITGGEPTIHEQLSVFCSSITDIGLPVKLDTNGTNPDVINYLISKNVIDYIAMDIKTTQHRYFHLFADPYLAFSEIQRSAGIVKSSGVPYEFRITCVKPWVSRDNMPDILSVINGAERLYLQKCVIPKTNILRSLKTHTNAEMRTLKRIAADFVNSVEIR